MGHRPGMGTIYYRSFFTLLRTRSSTHPDSSDSPVLGPSFLRFLQPFANDTPGCLHTMSFLSPVWIFGANRGHVSGKGRPFPGRPVRIIHDAAWRV
jgi:hypothetical protein